METMQIIGGVFAVLGAVFLFLGALGIVRMPDLFNRIQAGTKATTLGTILFLLGLGFYTPGWFPKLIVLIVFILFTNPVSSHAMARAAHFIGIKMTDKTVLDKLTVGEKEAADAQ